MNYFIQDSGHPGFEKMPQPKDFPFPNFIADIATPNNTDDPADKTIEERFTGDNYYMSTAQDPSNRTSIYPNEKEFAQALLTQSEPTLLVTGGTYANMRHERVEDVLPFAFPFGAGGPGGTQQTLISKEAGFQRLF